MFLKNITCLIKYIFTILLIVVLFPFQAKSDPIKDLRVIGSSVPFVFNTMGQYNNGITLTGWTRIRIRYLFTGKNPWQLLINAADTYLRYEGDAIHDIPVSDLKIDVTVAVSNDPSLPVGTLTTLSGSDAPQQLASGAGLAPPTVVDVELVITYKMGVPPNIMLGKPNGLYYVQLELLLKEQ